MPSVAAVDIGSNSVRLEVAETGQGTVASDRQVVRLGESVFQTGHVTEEALDRLCSVLTRMRQICRKKNVARIRAVATAALREAENQAEFVARASAALGAPVEIISGEEEARLIYLGVQVRWPNPPGRCLIVDVGGGSTELIVTENRSIENAWSLPMGALRPNLTLDFPVRAILARPLDLVIGTSATAAAVVSAANGLARYGRADADHLSASTVQICSLYERLLRLDLAERRQIVGIGPQRAEVIVSGTEILVNLLRQLGAPALRYSMAGVRDGIILELSETGKAQTPGDRCGL
jgi:exopolyphosphatase/guanosine-5'-triphosphate,3'-diphosphate pyrophosphatase